MGKNTRSIGSAILSATLLLAATPSMASATEQPTINMNPNAAITKAWQKNSEYLGAPLTAEKCVKGKGCAQLFENAAITWSNRTGTQVLHGSTAAKTYWNAGNVATLGALESDVWTNAFCGPVVTTFDGDTRHLLVVGGTKGTVGSHLDLNSAQAAQWKATRATSKVCFDSPVIPTNTPAIDWTKATSTGDHAVYVTVDGKSYMKAADNTGKAIASAPVYEVPWLVAVTDNPLMNLDGAGYPTAAPQWNGDVMTQQFSGGVVTWNKSDIDFRSRLGTPKPATVKLNATGVKNASIMHGGTGNFTQVNDHQWAEDLGTIVLVHDTTIGRVFQLEQAVYDEYIKNPSFFGTLYSSLKIGDGLGGPEFNYTGTTFLRDNGQFITAHGKQTASVSYAIETWKGSELVSRSYGVIDHEPTDGAPIDPAKIDWSKSTYSPLQKALFYQDGHSAVIVAATAAGTPAPGATPYRSTWLGFTEENQTRGLWTQAAEWVHGDYIGGMAVDDATVLGLPTENAKTITENGKKYEVQQFWGGSIKWEIPTDMNVAQTPKDAVITLNEQGKAFQAEQLKKWNELWG